MRTANNSLHLVISREAALVSRAWSRRGFPRSFRLYPQTSAPCTFARAPIQTFDATTTPRRCTHHRSCTPWPSPPPPPRWLCPRSPSRRPRLGMPPGTSPTGLQRRGARRGSGPRRIVWPRGAAHRVRRRWRRKAEQKKTEQQNGRQSSRSDTAGQRERVYL